MGKRDDVETGVGGAFYYYTPPPPPPPPPHQPWLSWLVPFIFVVDVVMFVFTMYENNCPETFDEPQRCLFHQFLGRFSFMPLHVNPLLGPSTTTLQKFGGLRLELVQRGEWWRLVSCVWLHAGAVHLAANMMSLLFIGIRLEEEFGFLRIGPLYMLSGFGGSLMSCLNLLHRGKLGVVSVGASGALFGLLGAMLSELIINLTIYANKCSAFISLLGVVALNLAVGFIPGVDNSAHIGGFISGFLLGFILLIRPQYGYISSKYLPSVHLTETRKSKHRFYQYLFFFLALITLLLGYVYGLTKLLSTSNVTDWDYYKTTE